MLVEYLVSRLTAQHTYMAYGHAKERTIRTSHKMRDLKNRKKPALRWPMACSISVTAN